MAWAIVVKRPNDEIELFGPFNTLGEVDDWEEKFTMIDSEWRITEIHKEPPNYTAFKQGIKAVLELKHRVHIEDESKFDFLGHWQAGELPQDVAKKIYDEGEDV